MICTGANCQATVLLKIKKNVKKILATTSCLEDVMKNASALCDRDNQSQVASTISNNNIIDKSFAMDKLPMTELFGLTDQYRQY